MHIICECANVNYGKYKVTTKESLRYFQICYISFSDYSKNLMLIVKVRDLACFREIIYDKHHIAEKKKCIIIRIHAREGAKYIVQMKKKIRKREEERCMYNKMIKFR